MPALGAHDLGFVPAGFIAVARAISAAATIG